MHIHDTGLLQRVLWDGDVALGDAFVDGLWDCTDVTALLELFHLNQPVMNASAPQPSLLARWPGRLAHRVRRNTAGRARKNIAAHYDLGNDLFKRFIDPTMS